MSRPQPSEFATRLVVELKAFLEMCGEALSLATSESQALSGGTNRELIELGERRKVLIPLLESALMKFRCLRQSRKHMDQPGCTSSEEVQFLLQSIQNLLTRYLRLDSENQSQMVLRLRQGLVPAAQSPAAQGHYPHYVAALYRRHSGH